MTLVYRVNVKYSGDGADGAGTLVFHGLSGEPPPDALQVQTSVELSRTQGNTGTITYEMMMEIRALRKCLHN